MIRESKEKAITLIALVVTIIVLIILAGVSINLVLGDNGIITKAKQAKGTYSQAQAREKLEMVLAELQMDKITDPTYNDDKYIDNRLEENEIEIEGDIAIVDDWQFEIDRSVPKIADELGRLTEEERLKPIIIKARATVKDTQIEVSVKLRNENGRKLIYAIREKGSSEELERTNEISDLNYIFKNLQKATEYEITIQATNDYGTSNKTIYATTIALIESINFNETSINLEIGESKQIEYTINPENATNKNLTWTSDNTSAVIVENGKVTAVGNGKATIKVEAQDGSEVTNTIEVSVVERYYLYKNGNTYNERTGGWTGWVEAGDHYGESGTFGDDYNEVTFGENSINLACSNGAKRCWMAVYPTQKIEFGGFNRLCVKYNAGRGITPMYATMNVQIYNDLNDKSPVKELFGATNISTLVEVGPQKLELDISEFQKDYFVYFQCIGLDNVEVQEMWLE